MRPILLAFAAILAAGCSSMPEGSDGEVYELVFEGNESIGDGTLAKAARRELERFVDRGFNKAAVDDAAWEMQQHYLAQGFPFAEVSYEYETETQNVPRTVFRVVEGPRVALGVVHFRGAEWFSTDELHGVVQPPNSGWFGMGDQLYVEAQLNAAADELEDAYYESGFLEAVVQPPETVFSEDRTRADVIYVVEEGVRSTIQAIELAEGLADAEKLRADMSRFVGRPYFPRVGFEVRAAVMEHYARRGHPDVDAEVLERPAGDSGQVHLAVSVDPGPKVHVGRVLVEGNEETNDSFIRSRMSLKPGELYDRSKERASFRELYGTGLFRAVRVELVGDGETRDLRVTVGELRSIEIYAEPGYGSYERLRFKVGISERDLFGTGRRAKLEALVSEKARGLTATYTDPWLLDSDVMMDVSLFTKEREEPSFTSINRGGQVLWTRDWTPSLSFSTGYEYRASDAKDVRITETGPEVVDDDVDLSIVSFASTWDRRDSIFLPREGRYLRGLLELSDVSLGSDIDFFRVSGTFNQYIRFSERTSLVVSARTGFAITFGSTSSLPLQERFFNGGANNVRSFRESQLGPRDAQGEPVGGESASTLTVEFRYPIWESIEGNLFWDAGNVNRRIEDYGEFRDIRHGVGPGLRWLLPIGAVRLEWGINPDPEPGEASSVLHFAIGSSF